MKSRGIQSRRCKRQSRSYGIFFRRTCNGEACGGISENKQNITVEVQVSDSTTGINSATEGVCDIGMASRELKDEETEKGVKATEIAKDGIAVIVNNDNDLEELSSDQVKSIFTGDITDWEDVTK